MVAIILLAVAVVLALMFWIIGVRNRLQALRLHIQQLWSEVDWQLQRRDDTLRALLTSGDPSFLPSEAIEQACQQAVAKRQQVWQQGGPMRTPLDELAQAEKKIMDVAGDLTAQGELKAVQHDLAQAIASYNQSVARYNRQLGRAPTAWLLRSKQHLAASSFDVPISSPEKLSRSRC